MELARRVVARKLEQLLFIEGLTDCIGRPGHHRQMSKANIAGAHRLDALWHLRCSLADRDSIRRGVGGHVAVEAHPVDCAVGALALPVLALVELGCQLRALQLQLVDVLAQLEQPGSQLGVRLSH